MSETTEEIFSEQKFFSNFSYGQVEQQIDNLAKKIRHQPQNVSLSFRKWKKNFWFFQTTLLKTFLGARRI